MGGRPFPFVIVQNEPGAPGSEGGVRVAGGRFDPAPESPLDVPAGAGSVGEVRDAATSEVEKHGA